MFAVTINCSLLSVSSKERKRKRAKKRKREKKKERKVSIQFHYIQPSLFNGCATHYANKHRGEQISTRERQTIDASSSNTYSLAINNESERRVTQYMLR